MVDSVQSVRGLVASKKKDSSVTTEMTSREHISMGSFVI